MLPVLDHWLAWQYCHAKKVSCLVIIYWHYCHSVFIGNIAILFLLAILPCDIISMFLCQIIYWQLYCHELSLAWQYSKPRATRVTELIGNIVIFFRRACTATRLNENDSYLYIINTNYTNFNDNMTNNKLKALCRLTLRIL